MSKGPSVRKLNPLCASSSCRLLTPKSASKPSRLPGSITLAASENALGSNTTSGISSPSSALTSSSRTLAASIASGSRSKPIILPLPPSLFTISEECPASPSVASQITPPGRTFKYSRTSSKRTGTCRGLFIPYPLSVLPLGAKIAFYSLLPIPYSLSFLRTPSDPHPSAQPLHLPSSSRRRTALHSQPPAASATPAHSPRPSPSPAPAASAESAPGPAHPSLPSVRKSSSRPETSSVPDP